MTDPLSPAGAESPALRGLRDGLASIDAMPLEGPYTGPTHNAYPRLDRAEAKANYLGEWVIFLAQRVDELERQIALRPLPPAPSALAAEVAEVQAEVAESAPEAVTEATPQSSGLPAAESVAPEWQQPAEEQVDSFTTERPAAAPPQQQDPYGQPPQQNPYGQPAQQNPYIQPPPA